VTSEQAPQLTRAQSLIWTGQQLHPGAPLYNMVLAYRIAASIDESLFRSAFADLVAATDALRTVFRSDGADVSRIVLDTAPTEL